MHTDMLPAHRWEGFLKRSPLVLDRSAATSSLQGKRILITGAGGSIGSALTLELAEFAPDQLVLLEASERNLYDLQTSLHERALPKQPAYMLGSVTDAGLLQHLFETYRPQIVYHAAAFKHVPLMEQNPFAAILNNALGTDLLYRMAIKHGPEQLILLSTDKAADPVSIMGASKRIAELILLAPRTGNLQTKAVRLGNVLGSEGSIVPVFLRQIAAGMPVTVTHPEIRRFFLTPADAVTLLLHAACCASQGVLVPDLGEPIAVAALAEHLIVIHAGTGSTVAFTQPRPGDKMCEALLSVREWYRDTDAGLLHPVVSPTSPPGLLEEVLPALQSACAARSLELLLQTVLRVMPEYRPSGLLSACKKPCETTA